MELFDCVKLIKEFENLQIGTKGVIVVKYDETDFEVDIFDENDWGLIGWDMDMYYSGGQWYEQKMVTAKRFVESTVIQKKHILNSYRVLLTRARKGLVIYIPKSRDFNDIYGVSKYFDSTCEYLKSCGIKDITSQENFLGTIKDAVRLPF